MFTLPDLPYDYKALEPYIDEETMRIHHDKHHGGYVKNLNDALLGHDDLLNLEVSELLKNLSKVPDEIRQKVKNNAGGHANHSMFWEIMGPPSSGKLPTEIAEAIDSEFDSFQNFQEKFSNAALGRFGSGWAWLTVISGKLEITDSANQDNPLAEGKDPILALDIWEHAYYLKYKNMRVDYIKAWWNVVNWSEVNELFIKKVGDKG